MGRADSTRAQEQAQDQGQGQAQGQGFWAWLMVQVLGVFAAQFLLAIILMFVLPFGTVLYNFLHLTALIVTFAVPTVVVLVIVGLALWRVRERAAPLLTVLVAGVAGMFLSYLLGVIWESFLSWPRIEWVIPLIILWPFFVSFPLGALITAVLARWPRVRMYVLLVLDAVVVIIGLVFLFFLHFFTEYLFPGGVPLV